MNELCLTSRAYNFFDVFASRIKCIRTVSRKIFFPLPHAYELVELTFKAFFAKPHMVMIGFVVHNGIDNRANGKPHDKVIKRDPDSNGNGFGNIMFCQNKNRQGYCKSHKQESGYKNHFIFQCIILKKFLLIDFYYTI